MKLSRNDGLWIEKEVSEANFGDIRLNKRFKLLAAELASNPSQPINQASSDWAAAKAAYRFFDNSKVSEEKILEPHFLNTQLRASSQDRIIVVQDTSYIDFTTHPRTEGLGTTSGKKNDFESKGLLLHAALALSEKGLPLGLLDLKTWARTHKRGKNNYLKKLMPIEQKESFKWFKSLYKIDARTKNQEVVLVCDREGDIYDFLEECLTTRIDFVIRARQDRMLEEDDFGDISLFDRLGVEKVMGQMEIEIPGSGKRKARMAQLEVKFIPVTYAGQPRGVGIKLLKHRSDLELFIVHLHEQNPPNDVEQVSWTLITSLPVKTLNLALEIVRIYRLRWNIELYFKCLKTGCGVENTRLASGEKLVRFIALQSIIAWRILWMTFLKRSIPEESCTSFLTEYEWKTLWLKKHRSQIKSQQIKAEPPKKPPSTNDAIRWIAMLGGFLGRKNDGEPGLIAIWRGWIELRAAAEIYDLLKTKPTPR